MTFGEGKDKVYMLLDEHSAGGSVDHDEDIEMKMAGFFDICQKNLAQIRRIVKTETIQNLNNLLVKYNKNGEYSEALQFIYNRILHEVAEKEGFAFSNYKVISPKYGETNFYLFPSLIGIAICITAFFAFRKRY